MAIELWGGGGGASVANTVFGAGAGYTAGVIVALPGSSLDVLVGGGGSAGVNGGSAAPAIGGGAGTANYGGGGVAVATAERKTPAEQADREPRQDLSAQEEPQR